MWDNPHEPCQPITEQLQFVCFAPIGPLSISDPPWIATCWHSPSALQNRLCKKKTNQNDLCWIHYRIWQRNISIKRQKQILCNIPCKNSIFDNNFSGSVIFSSYFNLSPVYSHSTFSWGKLLKIKLKLQTGTYLRYWLARGPGCSWPLGCTHPSLFISHVCSRFVQFTFDI